MKQPKALRLADDLIASFSNQGLTASAAYELRRLHEANQAMLESLKKCTEWMESVRSSGDAGHWDWHELSDYMNGLAAIAKGEQA